MKNLYIAIDGDNLGHQLNLLIKKGNENLIKEFATGVENEMKGIGKIAEKKYNGKVIIASGDTLLIKLSEKYLYDFLIDFKNNTSLITYSGGIGRNIIEAQKMLLYAKFLGKNQFHFYYQKHPNKFNFYVIGFFVKLYKEVMKYIKDMIFYE